MEKDDRQNGSPEQVRGNREPQRETRPAPGKVTRTSALSPGRGGMVQPKAAAPAAGAALRQERARDLTMDSWMDAAHRGTTALAERDSLQPAEPQHGAGGGQVVQKQERATQVSNRISDGPFGWTSSYQVSFTERECHLAIHIRVVPGEGVTPEQVRAAQERAQREFTNMWDNRFRLTERGTGTVYTVRTSLAFVASGEHVTVTLHPGNGRANRINWYVQSADITYAHELGHQLGLRDEYIDPSVPDRARADSPGVHTDHSIMGNYFGEGEAQAAPRLRHGQTIGGHIGAATERQFDTSMVPRRR